MAERKYPIDPREIGTMRAEWECLTCYTIRTPWFMVEVAEMSSRVWMCAGCAYSRDDLRRWDIRGRALIGPVRQYY